MKKADIFPPSLPRFLFTPALTGNFDLGCDFVLEANFGLSLSLASRLAAKWKSRCSGISKGETSFSHWSHLTLSSSWLKLDVSSPIVTGFEFRPSLELSHAVDEITVAFEDCLTRYLEIFPLDELSSNCLTLSFALSLSFWGKRSNKEGS